MYNSFFLTGVRFFLMTIGFFTPFHSPELRSSDAPQNEMVKTSSQLPVEKSKTIYVNRSQKILTYTGYTMNEFARESIRCMERLTRPMPHGKEYWPEAAERIKRTVSLIMTLPIAVLMAVPALACYTLSSWLGEGHFELIQPKSPVNFLQERDVKVISLNACFQDPWSPVTGGVETPMKPMTRSISRLTAIVNEVISENPTVYLGQEFDSLEAQDAFIVGMKQNGYQYFLRDLGSNDPLRNSSGLLIASKVPLNNIEFFPYPIEDRTGLARWSNQGALTFTISVQNQDLRFVNVHLNYSGGSNGKEAQNRQLKRHVVPLLQRGKAVLMGDFNFDTSSVHPANSALVGFVNALEGRVTCSDLGKHILRGKSLNPLGNPCEDCHERIDALVYDPEQIIVVDSQLKQLTLDGHLLSDHFASIATISIA